MSKERLQSEVAQAVAAMQRAAELIPALRASLTTAQEQAAAAGADIPALDEMATQLDNAQTALDAAIDGVQGGGAAPAETPPAETPPAEQPPAETPPAETPVEGNTETPPADTPPAEGTDTPQ